MGVIELRAIVAGLALCVSVGAAEATGDAAAGEKVFKKCKACHTLEAGKNKVGPSLHGVVGRPAGSIAGFKYSAAMLAAAEMELVWTEENIIAYVADPKKYLRGYIGDPKAKNKMVFKLKSPEQRENVVAYLKSVAGE